MDQLFMIQLRNYDGLNILNAQFSYTRTASGVYAAGPLKEGHEVLLDASLEDASTRCAQLQEFMVGARDSIKCWRAYAHNFSEKSRAALESSWCVWRPAFRHYMAKAHDSSSAQELSMCLVKELAKAVINHKCNKGEFVDASFSLSSDALLERYHMSKDQDDDRRAIKSMQAELMMEVLKKMLRKLKDSTEELATTWRTSMLGLGLVESEHFASTLVHLTAVLDHVSRKSEVISEGLDFISSSKSTDAFVRSVAVLASKSIAAAVKYKRGLDTGGKSGGEAAVCTLEGGAKVQQQAKEDELQILVAMVNEPDHNVATILRRLRIASVPLVNSLTGQSIEALKDKDVICQLDHIAEIMLCVHRMLVERSVNMLASVTVPTIILDSTSNLFLVKGNDGERELDLSGAQDVVSDLVVLKDSYNATLNKFHGTGQEASEKHEHLCNESKAYKHLQEQDKEFEVCHASMQVLLTTHKLAQVQTSDKDGEKCRHISDLHKFTVQLRTTMASLKDAKSLHPHLPTHIESMLPRMQGLIEAWGPKLSDTAKRRFTEQLLEATHPALFPAVLSMNPESVKFLGEMDSNFDFKKIAAPKFSIPDRKVEYVALASSMGMDLPACQSVELQFVVNTARSRYVALQRALQGCGDSESVTALVSDLVDKVGEYDSILEREVNEDFKEKEQDKLLLQNGDELKNVFKKHGNAFRLDPVLVEAFKGFQVEVDAIFNLSKSDGFAAELPEKVTLAQKLAREAQASLIEVWECVEQRSATMEVEGEHVLFWLPDIVNLVDCSATDQDLRETFMKKVVGFGGNPACTSLAVRFGQLHDILSKLVNLAEKGEVVGKESSSTDEAKHETLSTEELKIRQSWALKAEQMFRSYLAGAQISSLFFEVFTEETSLKDKKVAVSQIRAHMKSKANSGKIKLPSRLEALLVEVEGYS